jgi:PAS domain-containing protein
MNKCIIIIALILEISFVSQAQSTQLLTTEDSIKTLLINETAAYLVLPFSKMIEQYWILDEQSTFFVSLPDGNVISANDEVLRTLDLVPDERQTVVEKTDFNIVVVGDHAYVTHSQSVLRSGEVRKLYSHELRLLRRVHGVWKIHSAFGHHYLPEKNK